MSRVIQFKRGTEEQNNTYTGLVGEVTVDTTNHQLHVHDGSTQGGFNVSSNTWGSITGTLSNQTDLNTILSTKSDFTDMTGFDCGNITDSVSGTIVDTTPFFYDATTGTYTEIYNNATSYIVPDMFLLRTDYEDDIDETMEYLQGLLDG